MMRVGLGLGSNLGDRLQNLRYARAMALALPMVVGSVLSAPLYETAPVDCPPEAAPFLNSVVEVGLADATTPEAFLAELRAIESALGRASRYPRNAPRPVDMDILYASNLVRDTPALTLPHPRLHQRRFVLAPLAALRPDFILPNQSCSIVELLNALEGDDEVRQIAGIW